MGRGQHISGSPEVWDKLFKTRDLTYSEKADTQGKLFELVKVTFLEKLFQDCFTNVRSDQKDPIPYTLYPKTCLEVGCGSAFVSLYFAKRGFQATCLDSSKEVLKIAERNFQAESGIGKALRGKFVVGNAEKLPLEDQSFDIVMSFGLLEHFADPTVTIKEMVRVLKPNGLFFADIVPARFSVQSLGNIINSLVVLGYWLMVRGDLKKGWQKAKANFYPEYFENKLSLQKYAQVIREAGIKKVEIRGNRPFPRLTLPYSLDHNLYTPFLHLTLPMWKVFDLYGGGLARWWGAGWWFWGVKDA